MRRFGLRARVMAGFAAGALVVSASMAVLSYQLTRSSLLSGRERTAARAAYVDASVVRAALTAESPVDVLQSLDTGGNRRAVIRQNGQWYSRSTDTGISETIPHSLQQLVMSGRTGSQRVSTPTGPAIVVGIPIESDTSYYVIDSLHELDRTLSVLALVLGLVAAVTTIAGAALGRYATRRVLHPSPWSSQPPETSPVATSMPGSIPRPSPNSRRSPHRSTRWSVNSRSGSNGIDISPLT